MKTVLLVVAIMMVVGCTGKNPVGNGCCEGSGDSCASGVTVTKEFCDALPGEYFDDKACDRGGKCTL